MADNSSNENANEASTAKFLEALYGDPLRPETMRTARYLVIASALCVVAVVFHVKFQSTNLIPLNFGDHYEVLPMLLSLTVVLLLASFVMRAMTDMALDWEVSVLITKYIQDQRVEAARRAALAVDQQISVSVPDEYGYEPEPDPWWEGVSTIAEEAEKAVEAAEKRVGVRRIPRVVRRIRVAAEVGVPVAFGVMALWLSKAALANFATGLGLAIVNSG